MQENHGDQGDSLSRFGSLETVELLPDRYRHQKTLGNKAGRTTVLAKDLETQELVVIKLLTFSDDFQWEDLRLFEREMATLRSLNHPAIPQYLDSFEIETNQSKSIALVQNYIPVKSLAEYLEEGRQFLEAEVRELLNALLDILVYLHDRYPPVIHRDIKPSNILLGDRSGNSIGQVYLVDFGSVQTLATRAGQTMTVVGTYGYMPPEQFGGSAVPASDIYSLGCTALNLITNSHPADLPQRDLQIQFAQFTDLSSSLTTWLQKATHPSLDKRFSQALNAKEILNQSPTLDLSPPALPPGQPLTKSQKHWHFLWRSTVMGTLVGGCFNIFLSMEALDIARNSFGGYSMHDLEILQIVATAVLIGFSLGLINGIISAIASDFLSTKDKYYSHKLGLIGAGVSLVGYILFDFFQFIIIELNHHSFYEIGVFILKDHLINNINVPPFIIDSYFIEDTLKIEKFLLFIALPTGLISYSGACWYQKQLVLLFPKVSMGIRLLFWNFILRSTAMETLVGILMGVLHSFILFITFYNPWLDIYEALIQPSMADGISGIASGFVLGLVNGVICAVATLSLSTQGKLYPLKLSLIGAAGSLVAILLMSNMGSIMSMIIALSPIAIIIGLTNSSNARWYQKQLG